MPHDVFISYASTDKAIADATCAKLEAQKIRCWVAPRDVLPGTEYGEAIDNAVMALLKLAKQHHGDYDGWEAQVITSKTPATIKPKPIMADTAVNTNRRH